MMMMMMGVVSCMSRVDHGVGDDDDHESGAERAGNRPSRESMSARVLAGCHRYLGSGSVSGALSVLRPTT